MLKDEFIEKADKAISELVYDKWELQKAYNYYNGKRDAAQYRYLEENFGIGNPTSVEFIPLIRKHIDALVGEYLGHPIIPKVTCKDDETISKITREKQLYIVKEVLEFLRKRLKNKIMEVIQTGKDATDQYIQQEVDNLIEELNYGFDSEYEIAAQNVVQYLLQSRDTDLLTKIKTILLDVLITGYSFFRAKETPSKSGVSIEVFSPLNVFIDRNPNSPYVKDSYRAVIRRWLSKFEILNLYGKDLIKNDIKTIKDSWEYGQDYSRIYVRSFSQDPGIPRSDGIRSGEELVPGYPEQVNYNYNLIPVYEVEWLETDKNHKMQRYKVVRIGETIHIVYGQDKDVVRSVDNPSYCGLSLNGVYFLNRSSEPYSLVLACSKLQDKYDLLHFYRDNLIANSGSKGDFLDISMLPKFLGVNIPERVQKWLAYKKQGIAFLDSSMEGRMSAGQAPMNTIFNGYDDTVRAESIQAIQVAIEATEQTCSSITGVFRERLNGIEQRDAVTNVKVSVNNSFTITKQYYQQMDVIIEEILLDALNMGKRVFKKGLKGTIILGDKQRRVFTALPEYFTLTDYDIHVVNSSDIVKDLEQLKGLVPELVSAQLIDAEIAVDSITTKSVSQIKQNLHTALRKKKEENNQLRQVMQQAEQLQQQLQEAQKQLDQASKKIEQLNEAKLELERQKIETEAKVNMYKATTDRTYKEAVAYENKRRTEAEIMQLHDDNPYNDTVRQIKTS